MKQDTKYKTYVEGFNLPTDLKPKPNRVIYPKPIRIDGGLRSTGIIS